MKPPASSPTTATTATPRCIRTTAGCSGANRVRSRSVAEGGVVIDRAQRAAISSSASGPTLGRSRLMASPAWAR